MEAEAQSQSAHQGLPFNAPHSGIAGLDIVRALHQTVVSLRSALESSREEVRLLRKQASSEPGLFCTNKDHPQSPSSSTNSTTADTASVVNDEQGINDAPSQGALNFHIERVKTVKFNFTATIMSDSEVSSNVEQFEQTEEKSNITQSDIPDSELKPSDTEEEKVEKQEDDNGQLKDQSETDEKREPSPKPQAESSQQETSQVEEEEKLIVENDQKQQVQEKEAKQCSEDRCEADNDSNNKTAPESENESEEVDDIELIFTTDETLKDVGLQEDLVSINTDNENVLICNGKPGSVDEAASSQSSSIDREESVDRFDEGSSSTRISKIWSQCSVLVETDISKCGVLEDTPEHSAKQMARRNTLAAPTQTYRPIIHREAVTTVRRKSLATPLRPLLDPNTGARRESSAQTDISALPAQWRSESYLAHKVAHSFTTLPSKFALPAGMPGRLRLSDKTREARRVMLSDISFTSMVPELSRSADHLCQDAQNCYNSRSGGCSLRTPESLRRTESCMRSGLPSPCDCRQSTELCARAGVRHPGSFNSITSPGILDPSHTAVYRRQCWRPTSSLTTGTSLDTWQPPLCRTRSSCSSVPCSPTRLQPGRAMPKRTRSKVTFQECPLIRGSLPNLRSELLMESTSADSTESLVDEAEDYLRRSIDSMLTVSGCDCCTKHLVWKKRVRRHSEPDLFREWNPPQDARPYLPKVPRDLKLDHLVKVISPEGRILQGRVRYVGPVSKRDEIYVGVELPNDHGNSDGTFQGTKFFDCEPDKAVFVPFKKVVLAWCTT